MAGIGSNLTKPRLRQVRKGVAAQAGQVDAAAGNHLFYGMIAGSALFGAGPFFCARKDARAEAMGPRRVTEN